MCKILLGMLQGAFSLITFPKGNCLALWARGIFVNNDTSSTPFWVNGSSSRAWLIHSKLLHVDLSSNT